MPSYIVTVDVYQSTRLKEYYRVEIPNGTDEGDIEDIITDRIFGTGDATLVSSEEYDVDVYEPELESWERMYA